jgi:hypothetical membrane protein
MQAATSFPWIFNAFIVLGGQYGISFSQPPLRIR